VSPYEILAIVALAAAGGFAYRLYRSDIKSGPGNTGSEANQPMFQRDRDGKR